MPEQPALTTLSIRWLAGRPFWVPRPLFVTKSWRRQLCGIFFGP